ncbi:MAG: nitroreductase [Clostridia bacterium]|nr:nitroreductase [Clostridia bacterium]MBQ9429164.1 nitroreductase [Clostridia bacterium]
MEALECILSRHSVKSYLPTEVKQEDLDVILRAGLAAPSGRNAQAAILLCVTDKALRDRLSALNAAVMGAQSDPFYGAPCVVVVLADKTVFTGVYDGSVVMENLLLAAHARGLGACWIHRAKEVFASKEGKAILRDCGITGDYEGIGNCVIGYPAAAPAAKPVRDGRLYFAK